MKILILNWRDIKNPDFGGAEVATYEIAQRWVRWGNEVTWFSSKFKNCKEKEVISGIKIIRQGSPFTVHLRAFLYYRKHFKNKFDLVIDQVHGIPFFTPLYVKEPKIVYIHEVAKKIWFTEWPPIISLLGFWGDFHWFRLFYRKTKFITVSQSSTEDLKSVGVSKERIQVIKNGISRNGILGKIKKEKLPTLIFLGRLYRSKKVEDILNATKLLAKRYSKLQFWIVGKGKSLYVKKLENLTKNLKITQNVTFYGFVSEKEKNELLQKAWVIVMASQKEGWGLSVLEAAIHSTPSVVYNSPGLNESVIDGETGLICKKNTPQDLAKNVAKIIEDKKLRNALGGAAQKFSGQFSWDKTAKEALGFVSQTINPAKELQNLLAKNFWNRQEYLKISREANYNTKDTFWMKILREKSKKSKKILDVGCGDGTRLKFLNQGSKLFGLDLSRIAIKSGQKKYKNLNLVHANAENIPFPNNHFDLVFSAYTYEHLTSPEKVIDEMARVTQKNGQIIIVAPNYGSPLIPQPKISWDKIGKTAADEDTVNLPYLPNLIKLVKTKKLKLQLVSSGWEEASDKIFNKNKKIAFFILQKLRLLNLYPLKYWGPTICLVCKKQ